MRRIKAMYSVSCVTFFDQLKFRPDPHPIGEVNSEFRESYAEQCYDVDAVMPSETTTPDETQSIISTDSQKILPSNIITDFSNQGHELAQQPVASEVALTVEERKVKRLTRIYSEWREGAVVCENIKSQNDSAVETAEFKLRRRVDAFGYNQALSPYKVDGAVPSEYTNHPQSISRINSEARLPAKTRKPKAQGIQKVLENSNSPWFLQYLRHQQSILLEEQRKMRPPTPKNIVQSPAVNESRQ